MSSLAPVEVVRWLVGIITSPQARGDLEWADVLADVVRERYPGEIPLLRSMDWVGKVQALGDDDTLYMHLGNVDVCIEVSRGTYLVSVVGTRAP